MSSKSIYQRQCPQMAAIFERADSFKNVLIVALDFAKDKHLCLICNGAGDQLLKPFPLHNNRAGFEHLLERIQTTCKRHGISPKNVIIGGEDNPAYAENFLYALHQDKSSPLFSHASWRDACADIARRYLTLWYLVIPNVNTVDFPECSTFPVVRLNVAHDESTSFTFVCGSRWCAVPHFTKLDDASIRFCPEFRYESA
jgi:hypothetical protein